MNDKQILEIAKKSSKTINIPKRPLFKEFRIWLDNVFWFIKIYGLWALVKLRLFDFYKFEAIAFNRVRKFE